MDPTDNNEVAEQNQASGPDDANTLPIIDTVVDSLSSDADLELCASFVDETMENIGEAEQSLLTLESDPKAMESIDKVFRAFHTLKGTAAFMELKQICSVAHLTEDLFCRARNGEIEITGMNADLAFEACDIIRTMMDSLSGAGIGDEIPLPDNFVKFMQHMSMANQEPADKAHAPADAGPTPEAPDSNQASEPSPAPDTREQAEAPKPVAAKGKSKANNDTQDRTIRVNTSRLDMLVDMVGELVIVHSMLDDAFEGHEESKTDTSHPVDIAARMGKITRELQDLAMGLRMVPLKTTFDRLHRAARDIGKRTGKLAEFITEGADTEIDRTMVEGIGDPLMHMIRNSLDHGIESAEERILAGKSDTGQVTLRAFHAAGSVVIEIEDDGKGLNTDAILAKAISKGLIEENHQLSEQETFQLIFQPGFSTAQAITEVSGRGVGMDVVKTSIKALRGRVEVSSTLGKGTCFHLYLPLTMAITDAMLVTSGSQRFLLPTLAIQQSLQSDGQTITEVAERGRMLEFRNRSLPIVSLSSVLELEEEPLTPDHRHMIVVETEGDRFALEVDKIVSQHQVVLKSLGKQLNTTEGVSGGAILADGRVAMILDPSALFRLSKSNGVRPAALTPEPELPQPSGPLSDLLDGGGQFLRLALSGTDYAFPVMHVREIIRLLPITPVPRTADYACGVMNLRGRIIPVVSLRKLFKMSDVPVADETRIVVVDVGGTETGILVDAVEEVFNVLANQCDEAPEMDLADVADFVRAVSRQGSEVTVLLDVNKIQDLGSMVAT